MLLPVAEEMILLSKVIKSSFTSIVDNEKKTIGLKKILHNLTVNEEIQRGPSKVTVNVNQGEDELQKAIEEANKIRSEAEHEYKLLQERINAEIVASEQQKEQLFKQAEETGYNSGFQQGLEQGKVQYEALIQEAKNVIDASKADYFKRIQEAEPMIVQLALKVSEKIISDTITEDQERWLSLVKGVINEVREQEHIKLYVHPSWYEYVLSQKEELKMLVPNCDNLYIYPDVHLNEQGCSVETSFGKIDASVDSQLNEIKHVLLEKLKEFGDNAGY